MASIIIPNSVKNIGNQAFSGCDSLASVTIGNSVSSIGFQAFLNSNIKELRFEDSSAVLDISNSFLNYNNGIETLYLGRNIIGSFKNIETLKNVTIGNSVTSIESRAFAGCSGLSSIVVKSGNIVYDTRDNCNAIIETATNTLIAGCNKSFIPNTVTSIGDYAFSGCSGLTSITIPNTVTSIGDYAFSGCSGLTSITIPNSVTSIGRGAFSNCDSLTYVSIGNSVTNIGASAFLDCVNLKELRFEDSSIELDISNSYLNYNNIIETLYLGRNIIGIFDKTLKNVTIGDSVTNINSIFNRCSGLTSIVVKSGNSVYDSRDNCNAIIKTATNTLIKGCNKSFIPNTITGIGASAFQGCSSLISITIPNSVTSIENQAFYGCSGLSSIVVESGNSVYDSRDNCNAIIKTKTNSLITGCKTTFIPNTVTSIGNYAFESCSDLTEITIPNSITRIGRSAFSNCDSLASVTIGNSVASIGMAAFEGCSGLTEIIIPESVIYIDSYAFNGCNGLEFIKVLNPIPPTCTEYTFSNYNSLLEVPEGSLDAYRQADVWCNFTNITEVSGIEDVKVDATDIQELGRYDIDGRLLTEPTPGVNIIKMSDGSTRKEWVK